MDSRICVFVFFVFVFVSSARNQDVHLDDFNDDSFLPPFKTRMRAPVGLIQRLMDRRQGRGSFLGKKEICFEMVGCFDVPRKHSLKKPPQSPDVVDTKFWFYTRESAPDLDYKYDELLALRKKAELLQYGDGLQSIRNSSFDPSRPLQVLIHGFKGSGKDKGALSGVQAFLKLANVNVIVVDWEKGAADKYATAVANTELIGRQTAVMLLDLIRAGARPKDIHIIGFSLGAHIAGCAGEMLKTKGYKIGRITGLDPASPLFKHHLVREPSTKLDATKADFVDVIHTDGSAVFTDGFGLLRFLFRILSFLLFHETVQISPTFRQPSAVDFIRVDAQLQNYNPEIQNVPIGHVDFFPNGGREQRGCTDGRGSVVVSHIEGTINSSVVCSHVRAWQLFLESVTNLQNPNGCQFIGFPCQGGGDRFNQGKCFIQPKDRCLPNDPDCNVMGMGASPHGAKGALYLATRESSPFCGEQLQALVGISERTQKTRGYMHLRLKHKDHYTNFKLRDELSENVEGGMMLKSIAVAEANTISAPRTPVVSALLSFQSLEFQTSPQNREDYMEKVFVDKVYINDSAGNRWYYCGKSVPLAYIAGTTVSTLEIKLHLDPC